MIRKWLPILIVWAKIVNTSKKVTHLFTKIKSKLFMYTLILISIAPKHDLFSRHFPNQSTFFIPSAS